MSRLNIDQALLDCVIQGTIDGVSMTGIVPEPVGASCFITARQSYSVLVSLYGERSGSMTLNLSEHAVVFLASKLLGEENPGEINEDMFDAICEIGNMIAGRFKEELMGTPFQFNYISLPALVVGANYNLYHTRGITTASVEFEIKEIPLIRMRDKFFTCSASIMRK